MVVLAGSPTAAQCAASDKVQLTPAEMLDKEDRFRESLPAPDRKRLDDALPRASSGRIAACADRDGASCDAAAYLPALRATGLMPRFLATLCPATHPS